MDFRTIVDIEDPGFRIGACEEMLFVGSCFADKIGARFTEEKFRTKVNPYGVMYNPASILHTIQRIDKPVKTAFLTLGTNHVYILKETNEIVDNCEKRPQSLFIEKELTVDECANYLQQSIDMLRQLNPDIRIVITVSPIRYRKYGYHGSQLSKATLLLAVNKVIENSKFSILNSQFSITYFPAYEIVNDELRDYRFYAEDMLHPSAQAVEYIWQRFSEVYLSDAAKAFIKEWQPIKAALNHKPFNPDSQEYRIFMIKLVPHLLCSLLEAATFLTVSGNPCSTQLIHLCSAP